MTEQLSALEMCLNEAQLMTTDEDLVQGLVVVCLSNGTTLRGRVEDVRPGAVSVRPVVRRFEGSKNEHLDDGSFVVHVNTEHVVYVRYTDDAMDSDWT